VPRTAEQLKQQMTPRSAKWVINRLSFGALGVWRMCPLHRVHIAVMTIRYVIRMRRICTSGRVKRLTPWSASNVKW
jgi:putative exporter of polyketide antibiotics